MSGDVVKSADFVFDSAMVNYEAAKKSIQQVIDNGQTPLLAFVYRNPADAWFNGVQKRNQSADGHIVPEGVFANTHAVARDTFLKLVDEFGNKVRYIIREVADNKASKITIDELKNKPKYTKEQIKEAVNAKTYDRARAILDGFGKSEQSENIQQSDDQGSSADGRSSGGRNRTVSTEQQSEVNPQKTPTLTDKIRKKPDVETEFKDANGKTIIIQSTKKPDGVEWSDKKFKSENSYPVAHYGIKGDDAYISISHINIEDMQNRICGIQADFLGKSPFDNNETLVSKIL